ncbi:helix-turn-helix domain-containing protein [Streptomyces diastaticus]|uniref:helix-turn-helix domain-containing protein n=1 Tax=Streptomyces diastaticus TaxID=1956 RepID=UPI003792D6F3
MAPWKTLPEHLDPQARRLVDRLRRLKDATGLSFTALATRTSYSRSSWERYLNGRKLPPSDAVAELAALAGADPDRMLALHTLAAQTWTAPPPRATAPAKAAGPAEAGTVAAGRADVPAEPVPGKRAPAGSASASVTASGNVAGPEVAPEAEAAGPGEPGAPGVPEEPAGQGRGDTVVIGGSAAPAKSAPRRPARRGLLVAGTALVVVAGALAVVFGFVLPGTGAAEADEEQHRRVAAEEFTFEPGRTHPCDIHRFEGRLYAGHSDTTEALLQQISTTWDVVEAQCLLEHRGYRIGSVDGAYGAATERAVKRLQDKEGLVVDGIMGPHTWEVLRR